MVSQLIQSPLQIANPEQLERIRHTCTHIMAMAVKILFPETKVTIGATTDTVFHYYFVRVLKDTAPHIASRNENRPQSFTPEDMNVSFFLRE